MIILDCILSDEHVDIGKIINKEIKDCAEKRDGFLFFPCLITELCMNQGVQISVEEHQYRQHPQGALSAEMKERKTAKPQANLVQDQLEQEHLMQKHLAVWKFQQQQHHWLQERLLEISQLPTVLDTPEFPSWIFEDEAAAEEEEEKVEEEEESKKKKAGKRKREDERKRKGKKKVTEEIEELEETEEETEIEEMVKDMEREEEEDSEETISESDSEMELTMEEMLRRKSTEKTQHQQPPQSPPPQSSHQQPSHQPPQKSPQTQPPQKQPTQQTTQPTPDPKQAEPVIFTNPNVSKENLQVIDEEPEEGSMTGVGGSGIPKADATASGAAAPTAEASQQISKEQAESTIQVVLKELEKRRKEEAAEILKGIAEASGIMQKTPTTSEAVKSTTDEKAGRLTPEAMEKGALEKGDPKEKAMEDPETNQPSMKEAAETERQPEEVAAQSSAVAPGATAPAESTGATAPQEAAGTRPPKLKVKRAPTRVSNRLRSAAKPK